MSHTARHAIREWLTGFRATWLGPDAETSVMRPDTVRFVKWRRLPPGQIWYVTCDADGGHRGSEHWSWTVVVTPEGPARWRANSVAGGSGGPLLRGRPWANLGGNWGRDGFRAGGTVEDAGAGVARVRLTDVEGRTFEDTVENGVVLLFSDGPVTMPMRLDLIDAAGGVVDTDEWGFVDE